MINLYIVFCLYNLIPLSAMVHSHCCAKHFLLSLHHIFLLHLQILTFGRDMYLASYYFLLYYFLNLYLLHKPFAVHTYSTNLYWPFLNLFLLLRLLLLLLLFLNYLFHICLRNNLLHHKLMLLSHYIRFAVFL